jgi:hypothetical protein
MQNRAAIYPNGKSGNNICPTCNHPIILKLVGDNLLSFNPDGTIHRCAPRGPVPLTIGEAIQGKTINKFSLKHRRITLQLSDNHVLEIYATSGDDLVSMAMTLVTPEGIREEKR